MGPRRESPALGRLLFRVATQIFGGRVNTNIGPDPRYDEPERRPSTPQGRTQPVSQAARILERALSQVESMLGRLDHEEPAAPAPVPPAPAEEKPTMNSQEINDLRRTFRDLIRRLEDVLDHAGMETQRLADETARIGVVADRLEERLDNLNRLFREGEGSAVTLGEPPPPREPQFAPADTGVGVVIAAVPGFQGLMDVQRGLDGLPSVDTASVHSYKNGEAALELTLRAPVTAREIVEGLLDSTGQQLLIEEARPEALRLRLRFIDQESQG